MPTTPSLPITAFLPEILETVKNHPHCILQAEPGAGKSTLVPLSFIEADWIKGKKIILLEPRRLAVRSLAQFLADQLGEPVGKRVGYRVRNDHKTSKHTILEVMTEGVLIRKLQSDPELSDTALIIFDEFHERSLNSDLALTLCLDTQAELRADLTLLIMSATIDTHSLSRFLHNAPIIQCPGRSFPVNIHYQNISLTSLYGPPLYRQIVQVLKLALASHSGDCLLFLPGQKEIMHTLKEASKLFNDTAYALVPLYGGLPVQAQNKALKKDAKGRRKVIFATNIAETSLTIDNIHIVVDTGLVRLATYDPSSGMTKMMTQNISQASAIQRSGRAGRLAQGHAYRLWSETAHTARPEFDTEAILTSDLTDLTLELAAWGVTSIEALSWVTPPPSTHFCIAQNLLIQLALLTPNKQLTRLGEYAKHLGLSARLAKMLIFSAQAGQSSLTTACDIAAILSGRDILSSQHSIDLADRIEVLQRARQIPDNGANQFVIKEALLNSQKWQKQVQSILKDTPTKSRTKLDLSTGQILALAYPDRVAKRRSNAENRYQLRNGKGCFIPENDSLNNQAWLVIAHLDGQRTEGKAFMAHAIRLDEIQSLFAEQITLEETVFFNPKKQKIEAFEYTKLGALTLKEQIIQNIDSSLVQSCITEVIINSNLEKLPWNKSNQAWLQRVRWLAQYSADYNGFTNEDLLSTFDDWCRPYLTHLKQWSDLKQLNLLSLLQAKLGYQTLQAIDKHAPTHYTAPSGKKVIIDYQTNGLPTVAIQLQEVFGEIRSPKLAHGKIPITFKLLSPAQRPIQVTNDLANFWHTSYLEVAKEMRGKYPRHRWPEKPLQEKAGRSIQKRKT